MRAADYKHYGCEDNQKVTARSQKHKKAHKRRGVKILSGIAAVTAAVAMLVVPTTTLAPDVDAYEDVRTVSLSLGGLNDFSGIITDNCVEPTTEPLTLETTKAAASETEEQTTEESTAAQTEDTTETAAASTSADTTAATSQTSSASSAASSSSAEPSESDYYYQDEQSSSQQESSSQDYDDESSYAESSSSNSSSSSSSGALVSISNPDSSYSPQAVSLSTYDREKLERLVMGEAGSMGYTGCALVAQAIRDAMNRSNTTSIDRIISEYQYYGSTDNEPNQDVKDAVSFIFDENGMAVQHRIICFYVGTSSWHETQNYITSCGSVRFFDLWY